jgi:LysM repeat protein
MSNDLKYLEQTLEHFRKQAALTKEADIADSLKWLGNALNSLGDKADARSIRKVEDAASKTYQTISKQLSKLDPMDPKHAQNLAKIEKDIASFAQKFSANSKGGELAQNLVSRLQSKLPVVLDVGQASTKSSGLVKKIMEIFQKGGIKSTKFLSRIAPALAKLPASKLVKLASLPLRGLLTTLGAIPGMQWIWIALGAKELMDLGFWAAEEIQELLDQASMDRLTSDPAKAIAQLFQRNKQAYSAEQAEELIKFYNTRHSALTPRGTVDDAKKKQIHDTIMNEIAEKVGLSSLQEVKSAETTLTNLLEQAKKQGINDPAKVKEFVLRSLEKQASVKSFLRTASPKTQSDLIKQMLEDGRFEHQYQLVFKPEVGPPASSKSTFTTYEVKEGDSLSSIAQNSKVPGLTWEHLVALNKIQDPNSISVSQKIKIPSKVDKDTPQSSGQPQKPKAKKSQDPTKDEYGFPKTKPQQTQTQQIKPQQAPTSKTPEKPKQTWTESFKSNTEALVNEKNLGKEGNPTPLLQKARQDLGAIAATGNITAYAQAFQFFINKNILVEVAQNHRKSSKKGMIAEDLIALNRAFAQRQYTPGTITALNKFTKLLQQDEAVWQTHEQLLLALRKLIFAKAQQAGVNLQTAKNP